MTSVVLMIVTVFVLSLLPFASNDNDYEEAKAELKHVQDSIIFMMESAKPPIENLETDERIAEYAGIQSNATDDMRDGALIDIIDDYVESGSIMPVNRILTFNETKYNYWVESNGAIHQEAS